MTVYEQEKWFSGFEEFANAILKTNGQNKGLLQHMTILQYAAKTHSVSAPYIVSTCRFAAALFFLIV